MSVSIAYLTVLLVWSTTPLGMAWSNESVHPSMAALLRMVIALLLGIFVINLMRIPLPFSRKAIRLYSYSCLGVFGGMMSSYLAIQYITTGMVSLAFGLTPILTSLLTLRMRAERNLATHQYIAIFIAFLGLITVFVNSLVLSPDSWIGIVLILTGVTLFSVSAVLIKTVDIVIHPAATTMGTLLFAIPCYISAWLLMDGTLPVTQWTFKSLSAIFYLGVFGSLIGFFCYFYILQKLSASTVSLITMITPVIAVILGSWLNNEVITINVVFGTAAIITGLALYQRGYPLIKKH